MFTITPKLVAMLKRLPKRNQYVFSHTNVNTHRANFNRQRKRLAKKLSNPRLNNITFHTLRHWKAPIEYHKTKDIIHVKELLGHRKIESTVKYTHLVTFDNAEEFTCKVAGTLEEAKELIESGFEYVTELNHKKLFRKRK